MNIINLNNILRSIKHQYEINIDIERDILTNIEVLESIYKYNVVKS